MSQHIFKTNNSEGVRVNVTMGYDRPLDYVFCTVMTTGGEVIYSNLDDDHAGTDQQEVDYYRPVLKRLGVRVPEFLFREVVLDQLGRVGNRVVTYVADR